MQQATNGQISTTSDAAVELLPAPSERRHSITVINRGAAGFISLDGGQTWRDMPAAPSGAVTARTWNYLADIPPAAVMAKRVASGGNMILTADCT